MCGIVGIALKHNRGWYKKEIDLLQELLYVDTLRGDDSTGLVLVEKDRDFSIMKTATPGFWAVEEFSREAPWKNLLSLGKAAIGHNRKATVGMGTEKNAHPFVVDRTFAMVHNGTLWNHKQLGDTEVDSEALAQHLHKVLGKDYDKEKFEEAIGKVNGAYAIVAYDQNTHQIFLTRNSQRPLAMIETKDLFVWGSEFGMIHWCMSRNGYDLKEAKSLYLKEDTLYTIDLIKDEMTEEGYTPKKPTAVSNTTKHSHGLVTLPKTKGTVHGCESTSKNAFKRLKRRFDWTTHMFWGDDYIEANYPKTIDDGETNIILSGRLADDMGTPSNFVVRTVIDLKEHPTLNLKDIDLTLFSGRIFEMELDRARNLIIANVDRVAIIPRSTEKNETSTALHTVH